MPQLLEALECDQGVDLVVLGSGQLMQSLMRHGRFATHRRASESKT